MDGRPLHEERKKCPGTSGGGRSLPLPNPPINRKGRIRKSLYRQENRYGQILRHEIHEQKSLSAK